MRVDELRTVLDKYDAATLKEIVVALYKKIPKTRKEDDDLDELLSNFSREKTKVVKKERSVDFDDLSTEIVQFLDYADKQYYFGPNKYVRKDQRSKWRFAVKRFIKDLLIVSGEDSEEAAGLLADIYDMLSYACNYYIFSTENPFSSVGYQQTDLLQIVLGKIFYSGFSLHAIKMAVFLTLDSNVDRETLHEELLVTLINMLKTTDTKEEALAQCLAYQQEYSAYQGAKRLFKYSNDNYRPKEHKNYAVELYFMLKLSLYEYDDAIEYFWKNHTSYKDKEITLYCLLEFLDNYDLNDLWIREYEKALTNGIQPRENLQRKYHDRKAD